MIRMTWAIALIAMLGALASPAYAQRDLGVPATSGWAHAQTGLVLRAHIAGMNHGAFTDSGTAELDVMAQYEMPDGKTSVTFYLFRPALGSVPVWFDRSETQILARDTFGQAQPLAAPLAFAPPRGTATSGLRRVYVPSKGPFKSTGLAMMPLGKWLVAVRVSSQSVAAEELDALMSQIIAGIGWPEGVAESAAAAPVVPCDQPLAYGKRAKLRAPTMEDALMGGMGAGLVANTEPKTPPVYCRDLPPTREYGVYRNLQVTNTYVMAVGDAGIIITIAPDIFAEGKGGYRMIATFLDHYAVYSTFDKLPAPDDVMKAIRSTGPAANVSLDGKSVEINASMLTK